MASNYAKWGTKDSDKRPVHIVLFKSRNKDNKGLMDYHERQISFLSKESMESEKLEREFDAFVKGGVPGEMCRMYVSVNERSEQKIYQMLLHNLIDHPDADLCSIQSRIASIAAAKECAATKRWLFDFDIDSEAAVQDFRSDIIEIAKKEGHSISISTYKTPHGYAVITDRGFVTGSLFEKRDRKDVTLMKDDLLCINWKRNAEAE